MVAIFDLGLNAMNAIDNAYATFDGLPLVISVTAIKSAYISNCGLVISSQPIVDDKEGGV